MQVAVACLSQAPVRATAAMDIWQLGVVLFELYSGNSFWPPEAPADAIIASLGKDGGMPHERYPAMLNAILKGNAHLQTQQGLIAKMMDRNASVRPTAAMVEADSVASASAYFTIQGNTISPLFTPAPIHIGAAAPIRIGAAP